MRQAFINDISNQLGAMNLSSEDPEENWTVFQKVVHSSAATTIEHPSRKHQDWFDENDEEIKLLLEKKHCLHKAHQDDTRSVLKKAAYNNICKTVQNRLRDMQDFWLRKKAEEIQSFAAVYKLIQEICAGISESDDLFSCSLVQAGSVGENTKIGLPDEFDFVCILDGISQMCRVEEKHSPDGVAIGYANLILKDEFKEQYIGRYFERQGHLKTHIVWTQFRTLLFGKSKLVLPSKYLLRRR